MSLKFNESFPEKIVKKFELFGIKKMSNIFMLTPYVYEHMYWEENNKIKLNRISSGLT